MRGFVPNGIEPEVTVIESVAIESVESKPVEVGRGVIRGATAGGVDRSRREFGLLR